MSKKRIISVQDVLDAIEQDNVPLHRGGWFSGSPDSLVGEACILGQAAVNLGVTTASIQNVLDKAKTGTSARIISMNDTDYANYAYMVSKARELMKGLENITFEAETRFYMSKLKAPAV